MGDRILAVVGFQPSNIEFVVVKLLISPERLKLTSNQQQPRSSGLDPASLVFFAGATRPLPPR
jgi:hypothetical protein